MLLAICIAQFRDFIYGKFGLDVIKYISLPQLTFDCFLRTLSQIEKAQPTEELKRNYVIELCSDPDMSLVFESSIRGGSSYVATRLYNVMDSEWGNKLMEHILYLDANNLYGHSMMQPLPNNGYEWVKDEDIPKLDFQSMSMNQKVGYFLEVDISYPKELHESHADFPIPG